MDLLPLTNGVGQYFKSLNLNYVCLTQSIALIQSKQKIISALMKLNSFETPFEDCKNSRFLLTVVPIIQEDRAGNHVIEMYTYLLVDQTLKSTEWLIPITMPMHKSYLTVIQKTFQTDIEEVYPQGLTDPQFLTIYYLETRLTNPNYSKDQIKIALEDVSTEMISQYRQQLLPQAYPESVQNQQKYGVIFCHGQTHGYKNIPNWVPRDVIWTMVDVNPNTHPHLVGSLGSVKTLQKLGFFRWDYVLLMNCPIYAHSVKIRQAIRSGRWLLRPGGQLLFPKGRGAIFFLNERQQFQIPPEIETPMEMVKANQEKQLPQIDQFYEQIKEQEFYSAYIPFSSRDLLMVV